MIVDVHRHFMPKELYERYGSLGQTHLALQ